MVFYLLQGATLGLSATATPGPFQAYLLDQTLRHGWRRTLPTSCAPLVSDIPIVTMILLVLTQTPAMFLNVLQVVGGLFLLYLAFSAYQSLNTSVSVAANIPPDTIHRGFLKGILMNALSPGPYIFWSVLAGPIVIEAWRQSPGLGLSFVFGFYGMLIGGFALAVILFATASQLGPQVNFWLRVISMVALFLFGLYQLWTGVGSFLWV
jgi:threonine/homoserine/homoserine lactone efflux protein